MSPRPVATSSDRGAEPAPAIRRHQGLIAALRRQSRWVLVPIVLAAAASAAWLSATTPLYRSTTLVAFDRAGAEEGIQSQVQLIRSRDLGRDALRRLDVASHPEFAPENDAGAATRLSTLVGASRDRARLSPEEQVLERFHERLTVQADPRSRVLAVEFVSSDPVFAARAANAVADGYVELQRSAWREAAPPADRLAREIEALRGGLKEAERNVEAYRQEAMLTSGRDGAGGALTLASQELSELTSQLSRMRTERMTAEARARLIRQMLESDAPLETSEILSSPLIQRLGEQKARVRSQIAELSPTLGHLHPRMRGLASELGDLRGQAREEGERLARVLEADAQLAAQSETELREAIEELKAEAGGMGESQLQLGLLERDARTQRERLDSLLAQASVEGAGVRPLGARIVARAVPAETPFYPRPLLVMLAAVIAAALIGVGIAATLEMRSRRGDATMRVPESVSAPAGSLAARLEVPKGRRGLSGLGDTAKETGLDAIARAIAAPSSDGKARSVLTTSPRRAPEVAEVALRLSRRAAAEGRRVVLVDTRFNEPIPALDGVALRGSLAELISGRAAFESAVTRDPHSRVHVIASGRTEASPLALISSDRMEMVLEALTQTYDIVVLLAPALSRQAELRVLANWAGSAVLTMRAGEADTTNAEARVRLADLGLTDISLVAIDEPTPDVPARDMRAA